MKKLKQEIKSCTLCRKHLPLGPNPVFQFGKGARIMIIGQAPGRKVHDSGIPWQDASGDRLREWLGVDDAIFYDETRIGLVPMGFCYPGKGSSGDLPPREECAPNWHDKIFKAVGKVHLTILIGQYAQQYYLGDSARSSLTETVKSFDQYGPKVFPLPHPSPRNNIWLKKNPWFGKKLLPQLRKQVKELI
ncbi:MAG: uracil-DNA glycosylase family protein [Cyclobacteriaceae bacterium]|nr:uracil-DNA glycosylase family protein [Cyclobacteriaceae bacterium]